MDKNTLLSIVQRSPQAVAEHSVKAWLNAFVDDALVQDPIGSPPQHGKDALERFYKGFIDGKDITFDVKEDLVDLSKSRVIRITDIIIQPLGSHDKAHDGVRIPANLIYDLDVKTSRIISMRGIWHVSQARLLGNNVYELAKSAVVSTYGWHLILRFLGVTYLLQYCIGFLLPLVMSGNHLLHELCNSLATSDEVLFLALFSQPDCECIEVGAETMTPRWFFGHTELKGSLMEQIGTVKRAGKTTSLHYQRKTIAEKTLHGIMIVDTCRTGIFGPTIIKNLYVYEQNV